MEYPQFYEADLMRFFENHPEEQAVYETLEARMAERFPDASVRVQKSQISFYNRHLFAAASLPLRRKKGWPARCLMVDLRLGDQNVPRPASPWPRSPIRAAGPTMCCWNAAPMWTRNCFPGSKPPTIFPCISADGRAGGNCSRRRFLPRFRKIFNFRYKIPRRRPCCIQRPFPSPLEAAPTVGAPRPKARPPHLFSVRRRR